MTDLKHNLFQRADGRYVLAYAPDGNWKKQKQVTAPKAIRSQKAADGWAKQRLDELHAGAGQLPAKSRGLKTLADVHEQLMAVRADHPDMKPSTLTNNRSHLKAQILTDRDPKTSIAYVPMADVDVARARAFVRAVRGRCSPNHTRNIFSTARMLWDVAIGEKVITTPNPFRNQLVIAEVPEAQTLLEQSGEIDPVTVPLPVVQLMIDCEDIPEERRVRYVLAATSGADDGELAGLTFGRVKEGWFEVRQALAVRGEEGFATLAKPKTSNRLRDVPLHPAAEAALLSWRAAWERLACRIPKDSDFVFAKFTQKNGAEPWRPLSARFIRADLRTLNASLVGAGRPPALSEEKIGQIDFKALRRTFSSALRAQGVDEETRGQLMGHSGSSVTARNYTAHELTVLREQVSRIALTWPTMQTVVRTTDARCTTSPLDAPNRSIKSGTCSEARIGFEPTYDGFAKQSGLCGAVLDDACRVRILDAPTTESIGTFEADGLRSDCSWPGRITARPILKVAPGCRSIRVEVDGAVAASTDVGEGEPIADVEARLRLVAGQRGFL